MMALLIREFHHLHLHGYQMNEERSNNQMDVNEYHRTLFQMSNDLRYSNRLLALLRLGSGTRQSSGRYP